ncbi:hypothetical protein BU24DRAFT_232288 [Aaosphaeria arxii CBS 175.79]|uniref:FAS1 domain-containing protein n=1 Tax=Aaosphaeria arxii CBS 175.79 TaxID=1450172 RepID=A0A6A5XK08_9PLEO|nr:uncharacterized protein BU24DRAFT_232288 [Aaosphaeria arxii CBS 175.79]KAF2013216.1 hypothetical protein BU24DRAFT_232288 [Aaosphaeria arxii CBS 175.79]
MRQVFILSYTAAAACLISTASALAPPPGSIRKDFGIPGEQIPLQSPALEDQIMPPVDDQVSTGVIISDVIGKTQDIAIFSGLTRDIDSVSARLNNASNNATVLAPDNASMKSLERKPWEDPKDYDTFGTNAYDGGDGQDRATKNLKRFVESHIVPESPWKEGAKLKTLAGNEVWFEEKDGKKVPANIEVASIADKVANGEVWVIKGSLA